MAHLRLRGPLSPLILGGSGVLGLQARFPGQLESCCAHGLPRVTAGVCAPCVGAGLSQPPGQRLAAVALGPK